MGSFPEFGGKAKKTTGIAFLHPHNSTERRFQNAHFTDEETEVLRDNNISMATLDSNCPKAKLIVTLLYFFTHCMVWMQRMLSAGLIEADFLPGKHGQGAGVKV